MEANSPLTKATPASIALKWAYWPAGFGLIVGFGAKPLLLGAIAGVMIGLALGGITFVTVWLIVTLARTRANSNNLPIPSGQAVTVDHSAILSDENAPEDEHWAQAIAELEGGNRKAGLWARAFAEAHGDESRAKATYLSVRARELVEEDGEKKIKDQQAAEWTKKELRQAVELNSKTDEEERHPIAMPVETGMIGDRAYAKFRDGSVEIETTWGAKRRFSSLEEARKYISAD